MLDRVRRCWRRELEVRRARSPGRVRLEQPAISFTFDDFLESSATTGLETLGRHGARRILGARGVVGGINGTALDRATIRAEPLESLREDKPVLAARIARVAQEGGWLVFHGHDVAREHSLSGVTPQDLDWCVAEARAAGCDIRPVSEVLPA